MSKKKRLSSWTMFAICVILFWVGLALLALTGCTLHFKSDKLELETKPPQALIGQTQQVESDFSLYAIEIRKNLRTP